MRSFPKKYSPKELRERSKNYREQNKKERESDVIFSCNILPTSKKLSYRDFFFIYLKDFFNHTQAIKEIQKLPNWKNYTYEQLFIAYWNQIENLSSCYNFFAKRNQTFSKLWKDKVERHILSQTKKYLNANNKILESYTSSNHKIYIPNSDLYIYILKQFRSLWEKWKIVNETKIWYRSFNLQTSIPEEKILRKEEKIPYYVLKYFIWTKGDALYVHVDGDIDICCGDVALLVHPKDKRYNKYIWKNAIIPLCNRLIPIIGDETVNISVNNGIKRVCPCADEESIAIAKKYWLPTDIYVFNKQWLYTKYIHESAFIWEDRNRYYNNILEFIGDIGNLANTWTKIDRIPYLTSTNERLIPYKIDQLILNLEDEKKEIINQIFENHINYPLLNDKISKFVKEYEFSNETSSLLEENSWLSLLNDDEKIDDEKLIESEWIENEWVENEGFETVIYTQEQKTNKIKEMIAEELDDCLPNSILSNSQNLFWWKVPLIKTSEWELSFFEIEKYCLSGEKDSLQVCFDFVLLSLIRAWTICTKDSWNSEDSKLCEYDKLYKKFSENEKKIEYFVQYLSTITWNKHEYTKFLEIIEDLADENSSAIKDFTTLIKKCKFLYVNWNWLFITIKWIISDVIDPDFIELCIPCYLNNRWITTNSEIVFNKEGKNKVFRELLIQCLFLWEPISKTLLEYSYNENIEFLWDKQLTKFQIKQSQWDTFSLYWENPIRLNLLINQTFDQKEILLNNLFLKQIWNAVRLCVQKDFLPKDIEKCLENSPVDFDDFDVCILEKLNELYNEWKNVNTYEWCSKFFIYFKESIQNLFFSRYLEIIKIQPTKDVQFVCSFFFNFVLTILYPFVPEFVDALQYISERKFMLYITPVELDKSTDYTMNLLYYTFVKIKQIKIECNMKQHESCNIFIKSTPTIWNIFEQNENIFKNYFHISEISYIRLHEANPLWYEVFSNLFDDTITLWIQIKDTQKSEEKDSVENIEKNIKNLDDKLSLIRQRLQILPEWEQRKKAEEEYAKTKEEIENLTIRHSLLSRK